MELEYLEYWIDRMVNSAQWVGAEPSLPYFMEAGAPVISLERGPCFRECPEYLVVVHEDGTVFYLGFDHVAQTGIHTTTIDAHDVTALTEAMVEQGYLDWDDAYTEQTITDQQTVIISLIWEGEVKRIVRYHGDENAPEVLAELEDAIDHAVDSDQWIAG